MKETTRRKFLETVNSEEVEIIRDFSVIDNYATIARSLHLDLCVPSISLAFAQCVEYGTSWILNGFHSKYFKAINVVGNNIIRDYMSYDYHRLMKIPKPSLSVNPELDTSFDREGAETYQFGLNTYVGRMYLKESFFRDPEKQLYLALRQKLMLVKFSYKMKVTAKAEAIDLLEFCRARFHAKATRTEYLDIDYNIPFPIMAALATDSGFRVLYKDENKTPIGIENVEEFVMYLNAHSGLPIMYKFRPQKGIFEFYLKMPDQPVHVSVEEITMDDGDREGQLDNNFVVQFETQVRMPVPRFYAYYSSDIKEHISIENIEGKFNLYNFDFCHIPAQNDKKWLQFVNWDYMEDDDVYKRKEIAPIEIKEILEQIDRGAFVQMINASIDQALSPEAYLEIVLYNNRKKIPCTIDWKEFKIIPKELLEDQLSHLVMYVDLRYKNEYNIIKNRMLKERITKAGENRMFVRGHEKTY